MINENKRIQVCSECLRASCWYTEFMCEESGEADLVIKTVKELREIKNHESEHYWSDEYMEKVYGDPDPFSVTYELEIKENQKIYIVGPITGVENWEYKFINAIRDLPEKEKYIILSPVDYPKGLTQKEYMQLSVQNVFIADKLYVLRGYENSWGTQAEIALAKSIGMDIEYQE